MTPQKRRLHLIDKHMYPKNFFFAITQTGIDGRRSLLIEPGHSRRRSSTSSNLKDARKRASALECVASTERVSPVSVAVSEDNVGEDLMEGLQPEADKEDDPERAVVHNEPPVDTDMDELAGAMLSLQFVPASIRFGRGKGKAGFSKT